MIPFLLSKNISEMEKGDEKTLVCVSGKKSKKKKRERIVLLDHEGFVLHVLQEISENNDLKLPLRECKVEFCSCPFCDLRALLTIHNQSIHHQ